MRVRNNSNAPIMFQARTNAGVKVKFQDQFGNEQTRPEHPKFELICIAASAEVEIKDKLWVQATSGKTEVRIFDKVQEVIPGITHDGKPVYQNVMEDTGKTRSVNLLQERVKSGDLTITLAVASKLTVQEKIAELGEKKVKVDLATHSKEDIDALHATLCM
jgi:hypothetical protein